MMMLMAAVMVVEGWVTREGPYWGHALARH